MPQLFQHGDGVGSGDNKARWLVQRKIGEGQFAEVYSVTDTTTNGQVGGGLVLLNHSPCTTRQRSLTQLPCVPRSMH